MQLLLGEWGHLTWLTTEPPSQSQIEYTLAGPSGQANPARSMFLARSMFEVPQGMSLAGTVYVSMQSMFRHRQSWKSLGNLSLMSLFQSFVLSLIFQQGYCKNYLSYQNILYCVWKLTLSATTSYKNNRNTINGFWDICAERSAIALIIYFSRNISKTIYRIITFLDAFESWSPQL